MAKIKRIPSIARQLDTFLVLDQKERTSTLNPKNVYTNTGQKVYLNDGRAIIITD